MLRCFRPRVLVVLLLVGCVPESSPQEARPVPTNAHDLGVGSIRLPRSWEALDYAGSGLEAEDKGPRFQRHLFVNGASRDTLIRETITIIVDQRTPTGKGAHPLARVAAQELAKNLRAYPNQLRVLHFRDTLLHHGRMALVEATCRNLESGMDLVQTYAFYDQANAFVSFMGTARSQSGPVDQQNRYLFREAIESFRWK